MVAEKRGFKAGIFLFELGATTVHTIRSVSPENVAFKVLERTLSLTGACSTDIPIDEAMNISRLLTSNQKARHGFAAPISTLRLSRAAVKRISASDVHVHCSNESSCLHVRYIIILTNMWWKMLGDSSSLIALTLTRPSSRLLIWLQLPSMHGVSDSWVSESVIMLVQTRPEDFSENVTYGVRSNYGHWPVLGIFATYICGG